MSSLAEIPKLVGFFSYSREDDEDSGALSALRGRIQRELRGQLGRTRAEFRLFQDTVAIAHGTLWEEQIKSAIAESVFFLPIITPTAVNSRHCKTEFELFLKREVELGRKDLIFPILYIRVPALGNEDKRRQNEVLKIIHARQYADWTEIRHDLAAPDVGKQIARFCEDIARALQRPWVSPEERRRIEEAEAQRVAEEERQRRVKVEAQREDERRRQEEEAQRVAEEERQRRVKVEAQPRPGDLLRDAPFAPELVVVPAGSFLMGSPKGEGSDSERPQHKVTIAGPFAVGRFPVTFDEWDTAFGVKHNPGDEGWGRGRRPVINVSWEDAMAYVGWLTRETGKSYRLLSEAEWEYCCRAGTATQYSFGDKIDKRQAQFSEQRTAEVGGFPANAWGLHDMHGNVWEWCTDNWHNDYTGSPPSDGSVWKGGDASSRVVRGGSWLVNRQDLRSAGRYRYLPGNRNNYIGFRVARTLSPLTP